MELEKEVKSLKSNSNGENKRRRVKSNPRILRLKSAYTPCSQTRRRRGDERKWKELTRERSNVFKALSQDMEVVVSHLYKEGWLSGSDLKKVALCWLSFPCNERRVFSVLKDCVCSKCVLKQSCNFVNQNVWNGGAKNLVLADVMNTITLYALDAVPPQLVVSDEVKSSVSRLLKEVLRLSKTTS
ncbi:uncharacterized protein Pyn_02730 [Prunus yedoensis var. nudiflora]|uniref:Uncharacterized protein n=1 Tax=Prunus yedoensis var. nudiflora TaxID=2094558 RepID=A0A314UIU5_PRUYE|nr:uncharacterized protein Pyn_02730 [Prunus yedoensis var. nudiflora]